ncbi:MAG: GNAT family N-acetyltransferase [Desulfurococcales archaeon]|nr:GNAT family N-acetyltransferase [Desulfurococcales archaeon]
MGPLESPRVFAEWLKTLGGLKTFWTKPVENVDVLPGNPARLLVSWRARRGCRRAEIILALGKNGIDGGGCRLVVTSGVAEGHYPRSVVYVYTTDSRLLEPNTRVSVEVHEASGYILGSVERVQRSSWGFYMPPLPGSMVILARMHGEPVGVAYYNPASGNIDYGVHVDRRYWRMRIGTRILHEARRLALSGGRKWFTVIRVLRSRRPTAQDRRAIAFYEANNPALGFTVYRS